jgi:hypothetical protein
MTVLGPSDKGIGMLESLYNQLIWLDEIAGQLDEETNQRIDEERKKLKNLILALEAVAE